MWPAALFPSFTLNGGYGQYGSSTNAQFASNGNFWNLGVDLAAPIFDGGTLRARKQAAVDAFGQWPCCTGGRGPVSRRLQDTTALFVALGGSW
ncbi:MAG: TolC family protein [Burkholderiales bacterium]